jgi:hypothetical protein
MDGDGWPSTIWVMFWRLEKSDGDNLSIFWQI